MTHKKKPEKARVTPSDSLATVLSAPNEVSVVTQEAPATTVSDFPIVGIGASAGGLAAFEAFFSGMPSDKNPDMAFILIQHLPPNYNSLLVELIQKHTRMPVAAAEEGIKVQPNCVYIIPPNRDLGILNGSLRLLEPTEPHGHRFPIDFFFRSLAHDQHERAIGIILSGTGSDGTYGAQGIKAEGGIVMAQSIDSADFDGMPRSVINTGLVDYILPPGDMPHQLIDLKNLVSQYFQINNASIFSESTLERIFLLIRSQTNHDFSLYKRNTIYRRIERRMAVHQIDSIDAYLLFLQHNSNEIISLFKDLLIGVTSFFRDPDAFLALEQTIIPLFFTDNANNSPIRIWCLGCSTGEEAYSIAILLQEYMDRLKKNYKVQIFATDIDSTAIAKARSGLYPPSIASDISSERLANYFTFESKGYRINKNIRTMLVFSEHNVISDPPFSRLDLISCRNLLIYFEGELQNKLLPMFHYALNPGGALFLGNSENIGNFVDDFRKIESKAKLYLRKGLTDKKQEKAVVPEALSLQSVYSKLLAEPKQSLRDLTEQALLKHATPPCALINASGDILYLHGNIDQYLQPIPNNYKNNNLLNIALTGLQKSLISSLQEVVRTDDTVSSTGLCIPVKERVIMVNLTIRRVKTIAKNNEILCLYLVTIEEIPGLENITETESEPQLALLKKELQIKNKFMQTFHEELETSTEELKCSNEEMQSINEELQATNEELETSTEELQSVNEELSTVNVELESKLIELSRSNNDMNNLLSGTGIATLFLDLNLNVMRFTPNVCKLVNLINGDIGRPFSDLSLKLIDYDQLIEDSRDALNTLKPKERDVQTKDNRWYIMSMLPYRTLNNIVEGVVITFVDITEAVKAREALRRLAIVVKDAHDAIIVLNLKGHVLAWNPGAFRLYGWTEAEALTMNIKTWIPKDLLDDTLTQLYHLSTHRILEPFSTKRITRSGTVIDVMITATALSHDSGEVYAIATTEWSIDANNKRIIVIEKNDRD
ncbi:MAG: CheR family methyltransferase [Methylococcaceae bacterium]